MSDFYEKFSESIYYMMNSKADLSEFNVTKNAIIKEVLQNQEYVIELNDGQNKGSTYHAFAIGSDKFNIGDTVQVMIPNNNLSSQKIIFKKDYELDILNNDYTIDNINIAKTLTSDNKLKINNTPIENNITIYDNLGITVDVQTSSPWVIENQEIVDGEYGLNIDCIFQLDKASLQILYKNFLDSVKIYCTLYKEFLSSDSSYEQDDIYVSTLDINNLLINESNNLTDQLEQITNRINSLNNVNYVIDNSSEIDSISKSVQEVLLLAKETEKASLIEIQDLISTYQTQQTYHNTNIERLTVAYKNMIYYFLALFSNINFNLINSEELLYLYFQTVVFQDSEIPEFLSTWIKSLFPMLNKMQEYKKEKKKSQILIDDIYKVALNNADYQNLCERNIITKSIATDTIFVKSQDWHFNPNKTYFYQSSSNKLYYAVNGIKILNTLEAWKKTCISKNSKFKVIFDDLFNRAGDSNTSIIAISEYIKRINNKFPNEKINHTATEEAVLISYLLNKIGMYSPRAFGLYENVSNYTLVEDNVLKNNIIYYTLDTKVKVLNNQSLEKTRDSWKLYKNFQSIKNSELKNKINSYYPILYLKNDYSIITKTKLANDEQLDYYLPHINYLSFADFIQNESITDNLRIIQKFIEQCQYGDITYCKDKKQFSSLFNNIVFFIKESNMINKSFTSEKMAQTKILQYIKVDSVDQSGGPWYHKDNNDNFEQNKVDGENVYDSNVYNFVEINKHNRNMKTQKFYCYYPVSDKIMDENIDYFNYENNCYKKITSINNKQIYKREELLNYSFLDKDTSSSYDILISNTRKQKQKNFYVEYTLSNEEYKELRTIFPSGGNLLFVTGNFEDNSSFLQTKDKKKVNIIQQRLIDILLQHKCNIIFIKKKEVNQSYIGCIFRTFDDFQAGRQARYQKMKLYAYFGINNIATFLKKNFYLISNIDYISTINCKVAIDWEGENPFNKIWCDKGSLYNVLSYNLTKQEKVKNLYIKNENYTIVDNLYDLSSNDTYLTTSQFVKVEYPIIDDLKDKKYYIQNNITRLEENNSYILYSFLTKTFMENDNINLQYMKYFLFIILSDLFIDANDTQKTTKRLTFSNAQMFGDSFNFKCGYYRQEYKIDISQYGILKEIQAVHPYFKTLILKDQSTNLLTTITQSKNLKTSGNNQILYHPSDNEKYFIKFQNLNIYLGDNKNIVEDSENLSEEEKLNNEINNVLKRYDILL